MNPARKILADQDAFIGVYGGAFYPPHLGHVIVPALIFGRTHAAHVIIVPSFSHPFGKKMAPFEARLQMCEAAFGAYGDSITVTDVERHVAQDHEAVYTIDLLNYLAAQNPNSKIRVVMGADTYASREKWRDFESIEKQFSPLVIPRAGYISTSATGEFPTPPDIASSSFRATPDNPEFRQLIPKNVLGIISEHALYESEPEN